MRPATRPPASSRPLFLSAVQAGMPSPGDDVIDTGLDLNRHLIQQPAATFFVRVTGDSMTGAGIFSGDLLVVDRSRSASNGSVIIAVVDGELTVKRLRKSGGKSMLIAENPAYGPVPIGEGTSVEVWGVVTAVIHRFEG
jgi:DNA polymerase V